ncbi:MAG: restriction endonuclease [Candidatus Pedobacter colombiensis]|uniref:Restriction endonuclease n=1 Tax=Candidatus Pedobacter colombiensis TaxID=3121371 RepID=A0AAJ6B8D6_9SPHI|nr:restriction endonuclease [Pedobacter sp.]WEK20401.1 MAG: restriction endonuclease [Pedobacter sp.]
MNYNLSVLNDKEFEELCKDLLEIELGVRLQNFKKGKDKGIDLRFSAIKNNEIVIQAKHYTNSKFSDLKHKLIHVEKPNMAKLDPKPERYIIATSLGLNPSETDTLLKELSPLVKNSNDIYGADQIASLLSQNKSIEEKFYKLWITSTSVLQRILHNGIKGRSEFYQEKIIQKVGLYVHTSNFEEAVDKLKENNFLIISGDPGVGKTTIAYLLICNLLAKGFELIHVDDTLKDAGELISPDPEKKQIIFFDDFLGSNIYELTNPKNTESVVVNFIERIKALKNKYLILTTRTTILNQANYAYDKFRRQKLSSISKYELKIDDYNLLNKAQILYNHLFQSNITEELYSVMMKDKSYLKIIEHKNYAPRLIEFITQSHNFKNSSIKNLHDFIFHNLDNPEEIWKDAYEKQLNDVDRFVLTTLLSLGGYNIDMPTLETAFDQRYKFEIDHHGFKLEHDAFNGAIKKLMDGLIKSTIDSDTGINSFSFINPSVGDFLLNYIKANHKEKWRIFCGIKYTKQLTTFFNPKKKDGIILTIQEKHKYYSEFVKNATQLIPKPHEKLCNDLGYIYVTYFKDQVTENIVLECLREILLEDSAHNQFLELSTLIEYCIILPNCKGFILKSWHSYINLLYSGVRDTDDFKKVLLIFKLYDQILEDYIRVEENKAVVEESISFCFEEIKKEIDFSSKTQEILEHYHDGFPGSAETIISDRFWDDYISFIDECGLSDFYDSFSNDLDIDEAGILQEIVSNHDYYDDDDDHFHSLRETGRGDDFQAAIEDLFDR